MISMFEDASICAGSIIDVDLMSAVSEVLGNITLELYSHSVTSTIRQFPHRDEILAFLYPGQEAVTGQHDYFRAKSNALAALQH